MKITTALATTILSLSALDAQATVSADVETVTVQYADLDLDRNAGVVTLYQRIKGAANRVCEAHAGQRLETKRAYGACIDRAVSTAVADINRPMLSRYAARQTGKPVAGTPARVAVR